MTLKAVVLAFVFCFAAAASGGSQRTGTGSVKGTVRHTDGRMMSSVAVKARNTAGLTVTVLSQLDGTYSIADLPPGAYTIRAERMGHTAPPRTVRVAAAPAAAAGIDIVLRPMPGGTVSKSQLSNRDMYRALPDSRFKEVMFGEASRPGASLGCEICHSFTGIASRDTRKRDLAFWRNGLRLMNIKNYARIDPADIAAFAEYLNATLGDGSTWEPRLPVESVEGLGLNIRYETYDLQARNAMPHTAVPDRKGNVYVAEFGAERLGVVTLATATVREFEFPQHFVTRPHGVAIDREGNAWATEQGSGFIAMFDPKTLQFTEYQVPASVHREPGFVMPPKTADGYMLPDASPHSIAIDNDNNPWITGGSAGVRKTILKKFDRKTQKWTEVVIKDGGGSGGLYGVTLDPRTGHVWYAGIGINEVGYVDPATNDVTRFPMLSEDAGPRRVKVDANGIAWVNQTNTNKLARIDPKSGKVTEYLIPGGRNLYPYPLGIDARGRVWTQTYRDDRLHMFDPTTEKFTTFLMPDRGNGLRDFFLDDQGTLWAGVFGRNQVMGFKLIE